MKGQGLYSKIAIFYDIILWLNGYRRAVDFIAQRLPFNVNDELRVLDAGAGTGLYSMAMLKRFPKAYVVAFDLNLNMVKRMEDNFDKNGFKDRTSVYMGDITKDVDGKDFDLIITGGVLEYVSVFETVKHLKGYLKKGGYFLNSPVSNNVLGKIIGLFAGFIPLPKEEIISYFKKNNFILTKNIKLSWYYFPISLVKSAQIFRKV